MTPKKRTVKAVPKPEPSPLDPIDSAERVEDVALQNRIARLTTMGRWAELELVLNEYGQILADREHGREHGREQSRADE